MFVSNKYLNDLELYKEIVEFALKNGITDIIEIHLLYKVIHKRLAIAPDPQKGVVLSFCGKPPEDIPAVKVAS